MSSNILDFAKAKKPTRNTENVTVQKKEKKTYDRKGKTYEKTRPAGRKHFTESEVDLLLKAAKGSREQLKLRDEGIILMTYRHALRSIELVNLRWDQIDFKMGEIYIKRSKGSRSGSHYLQGDEIRLLRRLHRAKKGPFIFESERGGPLATSSLRMLLKRLGKKAGIEWASPHALRHAAGYALANRGVDLRQIQVWLGHSNVQNTVEYTELAAGATRGIWQR